MTNELIGDQWRLPHLEHEPAFRCHGASQMQRVYRLEALPPRHFPCTFGVHARTYSFRSSLFLSIHQLTLNLSLPSINSLSGVLGYTTGQCMLDYIHAIVEFMSQPQYGDLIPMF
ncbi:hypothetical protein B0H14DRAFT_2805415, partial [Mycena olivaceomarginata]